MELFLWQESPKSFQPHQFHWGILFQEQIARYSLKTKSESLFPEKLSPVCSDYKHVGQNTASIQNSIVWKFYIFSEAKDWKVWKQNNLKQSIAILCFFFF